MRVFLRRFYCRTIVPVGGKRGIAIWNSCTEPMSNGRVWRLNKPLQILRKPLKHRNIRLWMKSNAYVPAATP